MPTLLHKIPHEITIACSGGEDSMAIAAFARAGGRKVTLAYFNHGTQYAPLAQEFVANMAREWDCDLEIGSIKNSRKNGSWEEHWRNERYTWLHSLPGTVLTAHHLDDAIETWIFFALRGRPRLIPTSREPNIQRPFLLWKKEELRAVLKKHKVPYLDDPSNTDTKYSRNRIRHNIVPEALKVNPGLHTTIRNLYLNGQAPNGDAE